MVRIFILFQLCVVLIFYACTSAADAFFEDKVVLRAKDRAAAYAIPNIISTNTGTILCFATARIGDNHDWGNVMEVVAMRSTDNGATWQGPELIASIPDWTVRQTSAVFVPQKQKVIVFGHKSPRLTPDGERMSEIWNTAHPEERKKLGAGHFLVESTDGGLTWSGMKDIELPYWPHDPGISLKYGEHKGRLIVPARINLSTEFDWNNMHNAVLISDDDGDTWRAGGLTQSHVGEASVAEFSDGRIYLNSRNHAENYGIRVYAISSDGGETFTGFGTDSDLIEPVCDAGITQFEHPDFGNVILFSNPAVRARKQWDGSSRRRMTVKASFDDCITWPHQRLIFSGPSAYSGLAVGKNGMIFLAYERAASGHKDSRQDLAIARFNLKWLMQDEINPPVIKPNSAIFYESVFVKIQSPDSQQVRYTLDRSDPNILSNLYTNPITLTQTTFLKAACFNIDGQKSITSEAMYRRSSYPAPQYLNLYDAKYTASGVFGLVDGIHGTTNYNDGCWQGFEAEDLVVTIDLTIIKSISEIKAGFLQVTDSWIFYPSDVEFLISADNNTFSQVGIIKNENPAGKPDQSMRAIGVKFPVQKARYIRVKASNIKVCPDWHKGVGGRTWLFIDEIQIY